MSCKSLSYEVEIKYSLYDKMYHIDLLKIANRSTDWRAQAAATLSNVSTYASASAPVHSHSDSMTRLIAEEREHERERERGRASGYS